MRFHVQARHLGITLCLVILVAASSCTTPRSTPASTVLPVFTSATVAENRAAEKEVEESKRLILKEGDAGDNSTVIPRLLHTISKYPTTTAAIEARYWLGVAYYDIGGYRDAIDMFNDYLRLAPNGQYAANCATIVAQATTEYDKRFPSPEKLDEEIKKMAAQAQADPDNLEVGMQLAELLWKRGNYEEAGAIYKNNVDRNPEYAKNETVKSRIELLPNDEYIVLTPAEIQRRQVEAEPLAIINQSSFRSGEDLFTRTSRYYSVTGQVVNRSDSVLYGVQVIVTIYGVGNVVFDTTTVNIGRLNAGETRAFSVRMNNYDNVENINRYECVGTFQR